ncbi:MAG TPA: urate hydroxylase PuuD [Blastocatellia bacterium]|nr:urate hydroxylase PuuD [Blastocatellia bacterium]
MLPVSSCDLPILLALARGDVFHPDLNTSEVYITMLLRVLHILAGIIWIGHLYFFNLVNVNLMKSLDGPTKGKVIPQLMPRALWWFRWGALVTVLVGLMYYAMYILAPDIKNARNIGGVEANVGVVLLVWFVIPIVTFAIGLFCVKSINNGWTLAVVIGLLTSAMSIVVIFWLNKSMSSGIGSYATNKSLSIGIGGALGVIMLFNVWAIIWPNQKRIIAWTADNAEKGTAIPAESAKLARVAFLASRMNMWLSIPMLVFMAASSHYIMLGK